MFKLIFAFLSLLTLSTSVFAVGMTIATALALQGFALTATAFAINMIASAIISKVFFSPNQSANGLAGQSPDVGNRQQVPPATDNKLPVVYGEAWVGGTIIDLSISENNQELYYVLALAEVTGNGTDTITFGDAYWGGKKVTFRADGYTVASLTDESSGVVDDTVDGKMQFYFYNNGSFNPTNSTQSAVSVMQTSGLIYTWDNTKEMTNTAFVIIHLTYSQTANIRGIEQTRFQLTNSRSNTGDVFYDYLTNEVYGGAIPVGQIDTTSLTALTNYSNQTFTYTNSSGGTSTQPRFKFNGVIDTNRSIMDNLQDMASCCDCLLKYNEITAKWGVIVQQPTYTVAMDLNDTNMVSAISISPIDLAGSYNIVECKFPDNSVQDTFNTATFDLAEIAPSLLFPNEPVNKMSISLPLVNNDVQAQYVATRLLKSAREDLQLQVNINYVGLQLEAGDIVTVTNSNYGWTAKPFRINKIVEQFANDGAVIAKLTLTEFNSTVYDDVSITQFQTAPNTGISDPTFFGVVLAPVVTAQYPTNTNPLFLVQATTSSSGITQYAEIWYSAFSNPTADQRIFAGTTEIQSSGNPYSINTDMPAVSLANIPSGNWYFFSRMVNSLASSSFSPASTVLVWRPSTYQFTERYLAVAYADNANGTSGFSYNPRNKAYYGLFNNATANGGTDPTLYTWYSASPTFGLENYIVYTNRQNRKISINVAPAGYLNLGGTFVPSESEIYDATLWSGLLDPTSSAQSFIDLDAKTGQTIIAGATGNNINDGFLSVTNNTDGSMKVNLQSFLNFGAGVYSKSFDAATLTIDVYGRVVGFTEQDQFNYTENVFNATAGQTTFNITHTVGWVLVFRNGLLLSTSDYSETSTTVVLTNACAENEKIEIIYMYGVSTSDAYILTNVTIASSTTNTITYDGAPFNLISAGDELTFNNTGTPTAYTVASINTTTKVITFTSTISGATAGNSVYTYRSAGSNYAPFTKYEQDVSNATSFTPTTYAINNGFESIYINGSQISEIDYNVNTTTNGIDGFPSPATGKIIIVMYTQNNLGVPASNIANTVAYSTAGQTTYPFINNPLAIEIYGNGCLLTKGSGYDYTASANNFILTTAYDNNSTLLNQQTFGRTGAA
jgi:hypothetical protein